MKKSVPLLFFAFLLSGCSSGGNIISSSLESISESFSSGECQHVFVTDKAIEPTCYTIGLTEGSHCRKCGFVEKGQEIIKPSHQFELTNVHLIETKNIEKPGDFECSRCHKKETREITFVDIHMPLITIEGDISTIKKESKTTLKIVYEGEETFESSATFKLQGSSSLAYPKKNYNIQFLDEKGKKKKVLLNENWSKQSKYCLKANYIDYSQARNVVSGKIYGDIVHFRDIQDDISDLVNGGAIDGFPVLCYNNGQYLGLYTLNIPKDEWLFNMGEGKNALLMSKEWTKSVFLQEEIDEDFSNGWDVEYCEDEDETSLRNSFNELIKRVNEGDLSRVHIDRAIDSMLFTMFICGGDNFSKNILYATYDGTTFYPSVYDLDATWGLQWDGKNFYKYNEYLVDDILNNWNCSELWRKLFELYPKKVADAYTSLRSGPLKIDNIVNRFKEFTSRIDPTIFEAESKKWTNVPSQKENNVAQIETFIVQRAALFDKYFKEMSNANR